MPFLLALAAQTATPDPVQASLDCAAAIRSVEGMAEMGQAMPVLYFVMSAARDQGGTTPFLERYVALSKAVGAQVPKVGAAGPRIVAECRRRTPRAWATTAATPLPADSFQRRLMCMGVTGSLLGVARSLSANGNASVDIASIETNGNRLGGLILDEEFISKKLETTDKVKVAMGQQLAVALEIGNLQVVYQACLKAYPA